MSADMRFPRADDIEAAVAAAAADVPELTDFVISLPLPSVADAASIVGDKLSYNSRAAVLYMLSIGYIELTPE